MKRFVAKFYSRYEKKKKWSIIIVIFALILSYILFMTPFFSAMVIRFAFSMTEQSPPLDYEEISRKVTVYSDVAYPSEYGRNILDINWRQSRQASNSCNDRSGIRQKESHSILFKHRFYCFVW